MTKGTRDKEMTSIVDLIVMCSKEATKKQDESRFNDSLVELVMRLNEIFKSEYCAIGTIDEKYVIDRACTLKLFDDTKWISIESSSSLVCRTLGNNYSDSNRKPIAYYSKCDLMEIENSPKYRHIFNTLNIVPENSTIIIIQDDDGAPHGYLQFINSEKQIDENEYKYFKSALLQLAFVIKQWYALEEERLFIKDFTFINNYISGRTKTVDELLFTIMEYLSTEFNAGIISYRIPLSVGLDRQPLYFLRDCYVSGKIPNREMVKKHYFNDGLVRTANQMCGKENHIFNNNDSPLIIAEPIDIGDEIGISQHNSFEKEVIIIPILRDHSEDSKCAYNGPQSKKCFGIFKLRVLKDKYVGENDSIPDKVLTRLHNLAKHISVLLNAIVDKDENESLNTFQAGLNDFSFTGFSNDKEFDIQCAKTIKNSTGAKICAIYKYDKLSDEMLLSASTLEKQIDNDEEAEVSNIDSNLKKTLEICRVPFHLEEGVTNQMFERQEPVYYVAKSSASFNSMMLAPMMKKDGTRIGMVLLIGKEAKETSVSKTYWEQDKKYIKFMVDILSRIEESDADRLVFLLRLSHELRRPITELVYKNDFLLSAAKRNKDSISKKSLIDCLEYNNASCMMFKQIIGDVETSYYTRKSISYNFKEDDVKECILHVIRLFEQGVGVSLEKEITFMTHLSAMPQTMYVDRERIKQVFYNILKNAIQYSDPHSTITISYSFNEKDNCHEIDFRNYGIGITSGEEKIIFDLWKRGESAQKIRPNGTGMGLSIVREIMEAHGGKCYVKRLNNPTIFTVCIPNK